MKRQGWLYLMLLPWLLSLGLLFLLPLILTLAVSFTRWDLLRPPVPVGLDNYRHLAGDPMVWQSLKVTWIYTLLSVPTELVGGLALGLLMNQKVPGVGAFRTICYLPTVLSGVASALIGMWLFYPEGGFINGLLSGVGLTGPRWLLDPRTALLTLWLMSWWGLGRSGLLVLSGLQSIPRALYEAAWLDGAGPWTALRHITLPQLMPTAAFILVVSTASALQTFSTAYVATAGGPIDSTTFYVLYLYQTAFRELRIGYAAALAVGLFLMSLAVSTALMRLSEESS